MTGDNQAPRTIVFGFDALDVDYLDRFAGALPNLRRLRSDGVAAPLRSTLPPWTGSAWPSMYTGTGPSHHGVFGFFEYEGYPDEGSVVSRGSVDAPAIWNYLTESGVPSVVMNVPVTHPAEPVDGALLPGYLANEDADGYPPGVRDDLDAALGEPYRIYSRAELSEDGDEKLAGYLDLVDLRGRAAATLLRKRDWRFALVQVQKTDAVFHNFDDESAFRAVYEAADGVVGRVLDAVDGPVNVVLCSDHGMGRVDGYRIHLNELLGQWGYVETAEASDELALGSVKRALVDGEATGEDPADAGGVRRVLTDHLLGRIVRTATKAGVTPGKVYAAAASVGLGSTLRSIAPSSVTDAVAESVDWRASRAYCRSGTRLGVRVNLRGREPSGVVPPDEYEAVRSDLVERLSDLETPDGERAFERVVRREAVYDGPHAERAPDVVVVPTEMNHSISTALYGEPFLPVDKYDHERLGAFVGAGPGFADDATVGQGAGGGPLDLTDVAPVVMALLGRPVPERMTGSVPDGLLTVAAERERYDAVAFGPDEAAARTESDVTDRLADLGYL